MVFSWGFEDRVFIENGLWVSQGNEGEKMENTGSPSAITSLGQLLLPADVNRTNVNDCMLAQKSVD